MKFFIRNVNILFKNSFYKANDLFIFYSNNGLERFWNKSCRIILNTCEWYTNKLILQLISAKHVLMIIKKWMFNFYIKEFNLNNAMLFQAFKNSILFKFLNFGRNINYVLIIIYLYFIFLVEVSEKNCDAFILLFFCDNLTI